jgi:heavy metal sensor kinase
VNLHSLRFKLIWIHGLAIALVVVCIGLIRYQVISYRSHRSFDEALLSDAKSFVSHFQAAQGSFTLSVEGLNAGDGLTLQELEHYYIVTNLQGKIIHENFPGKNIRAMLLRGDLNSILRQSSGFGSAIAADGSEYRFVSLAMPSGSPAQPAIVHISRPMAPLKGVLNEYLVFYIYSVPLILAISAAVGWYLTGRALKPFEEITQTAEKITYENLNIQIFTRHKEEEVQRLVQSFNGMVLRLDESFQQMRKFNADVAHELRTPLAILQGETEIALRSPNLPEEIRSVLASNLEELDRLTGMVNEMLTLAEAEAGRHVLSKESVDVKELLEDLVDQMRLLATDRNIQIDLQGIPELWIEADKLWIRRAIINLLDNAIKYSREGGKIEVTAGRQGSMARLEIRDYGIGISADALPHIFDRLYRADPARNRDSGGIGLGLALVKWIIEAHMGNIQVRSQPDLGACFEIILPAKHVI